MGAHPQQQQQHAIRSSAGAASPRSKRAFLSSAALILLGFLLGSYTSSAWHQHTVVSLHAAVHTTEHVPLGTAAAHQQARRQQHAGEQAGLDRSSSSSSSRVHIQLMARRAGSGTAATASRSEGQGQQAAVRRLPASNSAATTQASDLYVAAARMQHGGSTHSSSSSSTDRSHLPAAQSAGGSIQQTSGTTLIGKTSVMFGVIGRDVASELPYVLRNIGRLAAHFKQAHVVLVENDSTDDTRGVFTTWGQAFTSATPSNRTARLVTLDVHAGKKDISVLARARNAYIEALARPEYASVEFLIAVDSDMCFPWDVRRMTRAIEALLPAAGTAWHALYANGVCGWYKPLHAAGQEEVPPHTPGGAPVYCDLLALRDTQGSTHTMVANSMVSFVPDSCDFRFMSNGSAAGFTCSHINGQAVVPVQAAFGGWAMYDASMLRRGRRGSDACKHDVHAGGCEHWSLSSCLAIEGAVQLVVTGLVVNWEGCSEKEQHRWDGWYPGRGPG